MLVLFRIKQDIDSSPQSVTCPVSTQYRAVRAGKPVGGDLFMRAGLLTRFLGSGILSLGLTCSAVAQPAPVTGTSGRICRGLLSIGAMGKDFVYVWVRVNPNDSADVWTRGGPQVAPEAIPPPPPAEAHHSVTQMVGHLAEGFIGVSLWQPIGPPLTLSVSESAHTMATARQRSGLACSG
jgi:hypothetical protein